MQQGIIGEPIEVETHTKGFQRMIDLRGGIQKYVLDGVFLHILCTYASLPFLRFRSLLQKNRISYFIERITSQPSSSNPTPCIHLHPLTRLSSPLHILTAPYLSKNLHSSNPLHYHMVSILQWLICYMIWGICTLC